MELPAGTVVGQKEIKDKLKRTNTVKAHTVVDTLILNRDEYLDVYSIAKKKEKHIFTEFVNSVDFFRNLSEYKKILIVNMLSR